jgi:glycerol transport system ATP-binding protein
MSFSISKVDKIVGREMYLADIDLHLESGSQNVILGRTLAGKTTLLRIMAGLDRPSRGRILENGTDMTGVSVRKRNVAMVYQQFVNYPSLSVFHNIASPLKLAGLHKDVIAAKVRDTAAVLHIDHLLDRLPQELSGGQQQRTAIARALVKEASLLLLDEPLVNLDYKLREELRAELREIFGRRDSIVVYTTTEPSEALMLGGNLVVMHEGRVLQTGPAEEVYRRPATVRVAEILSDPPINVLRTRVDQTAAHLGEGLSVPLDGHLTGLPPGDYLFGVRSHHLFLNRQHPRDIELHARVELAEINGSETFIHLTYNGRPLVVQEEGVHQYRIGDAVSFFVRPRKFYIFGQEGALVRAPLFEDI